MTRQSLVVSTCSSSNRHTWSHVTQLVFIHFKQFFQTKLHDKTAIFQPQQTLKDCTKYSI